VATHPGRGWSDAVDHEAHRTFYNWLGCAVGAAQHEAAQMPRWRPCMLLQPAAQASLLGRKERVDMASAALVNGITSHTFDFDDTHLKTIIHPAGPVASAVLALAEHTGASGRALIDALVLGIDVSCRVGNAMYPDHYDRGWHITGSTGTLGAAAACARLLGLDAQQTAMALGIAASQPVGARAVRHHDQALPPGRRRTRRADVGAAGEPGLHGQPAPLEAPRGMMQTVSTKNDWREITDELGQRFEISFNSYKPLPAAS
jgi:2-methylcitrate dehydratase PrpD